MVSSMYLPLCLNDLALDVLQIMRLIAIFALANNEPWRMAEKIIHLLQWSSRRLGQQQPEEYGVGEVADNEEIVVSIPDVGHGNGCDLALSWC